jgi:hypothetical protein
MAKHATAPPGQHLERGIRLSDPSFRNGYVFLDVFWSGSRVAPEIHEACLPGDYLDVWPEMDALTREKLRHQLIKRLNK